MKNPKREVITVVSESVCSEQSSVRDLDLCEEPPVSHTALPAPSALMVKTFGSTIRDLTFNGYLR
ncbi:hypothetical protein SAMN05216593_101606 [Pseudomonas asturiensis]|uniref:Uncharacterized protein n=1 Tax=Pseudomonas asturiensis TaxID=1190415 RepID=A0A1M7JXM7_9PSED|nr:hypothetical protein SAMN05216593_101606 [Pseudomonas asturiensis]